MTAMTPVVLALALAAGQPVELSFQGPLSEAIRRIAKEGGLNVVVADELTQPVQVDLNDVGAQEALESLGKAYGLSVQKEGALWVVRRAPAPTAPTTPVAEPVAPVAPVVVAAQPPPAVPEPAPAPVPAVKVPVGPQKRQGDLVSTGQPVVVRANERVDSAISYGGSVVLEPGAEVSDDAVSFGADVVVGDNAVVRGDAVSFGGQIIKEGSGRVLGREVSMGGSSIGQAVASQAVKHSAEPEADDDDEAEAKASGPRLASFFAWFAVLFGLGFVFSLMAPERMKRLEASIREAPLKNGVLGFVLMVASVPATLLLLISLIGIPVAMVLWGAASAAVAVGLALVANVIGATLPVGRARRTQALVLALGALVLVAIKQIPYIGTAVFFIAALVALGAMLSTRLGQPVPGLPMPDPDFSVPVR